MGWILKVIGVFVGCIIVVFLGIVIIVWYVFGELDEEELEEEIKREVERKKVKVLVWKKVLKIDVKV